MDPMPNMSYSLMPASLIEGLTLGCLLLAILIAFIWHTGLNAQQRWVQKLSAFLKEKPEHWLMHTNASWLYQQLQTKADVWLRLLPYVLCSLAFIVGLVQLYDIFSLLHHSKDHTSLLLLLTEQAKIFIWLLVAYGAIRLMYYGLASEQRLHAWLHEQVVQQQCSQVQDMNGGTSTAALLQKLLDVGREQEVVNVQSLAKIQTVLEQLVSRSAEAHTPFTLDPLLEEMQKSLAVQQIMADSLDKIQAQQATVVRSSDNQSATGAVPMQNLVQRLDVIQSKLQEHMTAQQSVLLSVLQTVKDGQISTGTQSEKLHQEFRVLIAAIERKLAETHANSTVGVSSERTHLLASSAPIESSTVQSPTHPLASRAPQIPAGTQQMPVLKTEPSIYSYHSSQAFNEEGNSSVWPTYSGQSSSSNPQDSSVDSDVFDLNSPIEHVAVPSLAHPLQREMVAQTSGVSSELVDLLKNWRASYDENMQKLLEFGQMSSSATKTISQIVFQQEQFLAKIHQHQSMLLDYSKISSHEQQKILQLLEARFGETSATEEGTESTNAEASAKWLPVLEQQHQAILAQHQTGQVALTQIIAHLEAIQTHMLDTSFAKSDSALQDIIEQLPEQLEKVWQGYQETERSALIEFAERLQTSIGQQQTSESHPPLGSPAIEKSLEDLRSNMEQASTYMVEALDRMEQHITPPNA